VTEQQVDWSKVTLPCPQCGAAMVVRVNSTTGSRFMGCSMWPVVGCNGRGSVPAYAILKAQGALQLPGMEGL